MKRINLFQMGCGTIGYELISQICSSLASDANREDVDLRWSCIADSKRLAFFPKGQPALGLNYPSSGLSELQDCQWFEGGTQARLELCLDLAHQADGVSILVDTTASSKMQSFYEKFLGASHGVASANKIPFSSSLEDFESLVDFQRPLENALRFEATVGAGLPIIHAVLSLLETGDQISAIEGCFSGSMGTLFSGMTAGRPFSDLLVSAWEAGFTEPDPRDDLSGMDVARKVLILARLIGQKLEMQDVTIQNLVPENLRNVPLPEFKSRLKEMDPLIASEFSKALQGNKVLRYCGASNPSKVEARLRMECQDSPLGSLRGTDNLCVVTTERYEQPLVIRGPGAGPGVTAAGVFHDILESSRILLAKDAR